MESIDRWFSIITKIRFLILDYLEEKSEQKEEIIIEKINALRNELFMEEVIATKHMNSFNLVPSIGINQKFRDLMYEFYLQYSFAQNEYRDFLFSYFRKNVLWGEDFSKQPNVVKPSIDHEQEGEKLNEAILRAGKVHEILRDILILVRDFK